MAKTTLIGDEYASVLSLATGSTSAARSLLLPLGTSSSQQEFEGRAIFSKPKAHATALDRAPAPDPGADARQIGALERVEFLAAEGVAAGHFDIAELVAAGNAAGAPAFRLALEQALGKSYDTEAWSELFDELADGEIPPGLWSPLSVLARRGLESESMWVRAAAARALLSVDPIAAANLLPEFSKSEVNPLVLSIIDGVLRSVRK